jgi:hypothetical protein
MIRSHLAQANRYIAEMKADIARERVIVEHALDAGYLSFPKIPSGLGVASSGRIVA